jgi:hypothetical protein
VNRRKPGALLHRIVEERIDAERELRQQATESEHAQAVLKFHEVEMLALEHQRFHDREHLLYDEAIDKATDSLSTRLGAIESDLVRWRDSASTFMTREAFDREHRGLIEKTDAALARVEEKIGAEERVTLQQSTAQQTRDALLNELSTNRRWMVGLGVTIGLTLLVTILNWLKLI